ncbi:MAG: ATP-binding protein [Lentisphaeraceae bacterium]|nr:ATP-binding protein [Lentisphaeraceae bacterium]
MEYEEAIPQASNLIQSLRDIGYSLETAVADIIDNSISAKASEVDIITVFEEGNTKFSILDNGAGMSASELKSSMMLGSLSPTMERDPTDLGRFGLGLKTASFSQAEKLTVISKKDGVLSGREWDLQYVAKTNKWSVRVLSDVEISEVEHIAKISNSGTIVLWQGLDRIIEASTARRKGSEIFNEKIINMRRHLELVYHRFLSSKSFNITINNSPLKGFDPFESSINTITSPVEILKKGSKIIGEVQAHTLPHHSKIDPDEWERLAGKDGYLKSQGCYVYRAKRLLIHGTWFRLAPQTDATKLARVRIDLNNDVDFDWKLDVKKSHATPPQYVRDRLKNIIDKFTADSKRVYTSRGAKINKKDHIAMWLEVHKHNIKRFTINKDHPLINNFVQKLTFDDQLEFKNIVNLIESLLPIDSIFSELSSNPKDLDQKHELDDTLEKNLRTFVNFLLSMDSTEEEIIKQIRKTEPFSLKPEQCINFLKQKV